MIETALVIPVLLTLVFGVIGVDRLIQARIGVSAVAHEAARSAALANNAAEASQQGMARARDVAAGYGLNNGSLKVTVDPGSFQRGAEVEAAAQYDVPLQDLPLLKWTHIQVTAQDRERIDLYRSRWQAGNPS